MKTIKFNSKYTNDVSIENIMDRRTKETIQIKCPHCGIPVNLTEAYINNQMEKILDDTVKRVNEFIYQISIEVENLCGEKAMTNYILRKIDEIAREKLSPELKILKGGKNKKMKEDDK